MIDSTTEYEQFKKAVGLHVRALREHKELSRPDLVRAGLSNSVIENFEAGRKLGLKSLWRISKAMAVTPRDMLPWDVQPRKGRKRRL